MGGITTMAKTWVRKAFIVLEFGAGASPYLINLWCSVPRKKWLVVKDFLGNRTTRCPTAPIMRYEQEKGA